MQPLDCDYMSGNLLPGKTSCLSLADKDYNQFQIFF